MSAPFTSNKKWKPYISSTFLLVLAVLLAIIKKKIQQYNSQDDNNSIITDKPPFTIYVYRIPFNLLHASSTDSQDDGNRKVMSMESCPFNQVYGTELAMSSILSASPYSIDDNNAQSADYYYIPHYSSCFYHLCLQKNNSNTTICQEKTVNYLTEILDWIEAAYPWWTINGGSDHLMTLSWDHASTLFGDPESVIRNRIGSTIHLTHAAYQQPRMDFDPLKDISIPVYRQYDYIEFLLKAMENKKGKSNVNNGNNNKHYHNDIEETNRTIFAYFRGTIHPDRSYSDGIRQRLVELAEERPNLFFVKQGHSDFYWSELSKSKFAICPLGWSVWSPRLTDAIIAGAIPVIISDNYKPPFDSLIDWNKIAIFIAQKDIDMIEKILLSLSSQKIKEMREKIFKISHKFKYHNPPQKNDAFDSIMTILSKRPKPTKRIVYVEEEHEEGEMVSDGQSYNNDNDDSHFNSEEQNKALEEENHKRHEEKDSIKVEL